MRKPKSKEIPTTFRLDLHQKHIVATALQDAFAKIQRVRYHDPLDQLLYDTERAKFETEYATHKLGRLRIDVVGDGR